MAQQSIKVDAGTGSAVDFSQTTGTNYRQVVTLGDPTTDANYVAVDNSNLHVKFSNSTITAINPSSTITISGSVAVNIGQTIEIVAGTALIGRVTAINPSSTIEIVAGTALIGRVAASGETSTIYNGVSVLTPQFTVISVNMIGNSNIINATSGKQTRVLAMNFIASTAVAVYITDGAGGGGLNGTSTNPQFYASSGGIVLPHNPIGWFQTSVGNTLVMNLSTTVWVGGSVVYVAV